MTCLFPIFLECKEWTLDPFWQEIFEQCSVGKFPKGMKMMKDGSVVIFVGKTREVFSTSGEPLDVFKTMMTVFKDKLGMISERDMKKQKKELLELKEKMKESYAGTWKQIRPKNIKNNLLINFVIQKQKELGLSNKLAEKLLAMITLGFIFKTITSDDIEYSDGVIHNINGIEISSDGIINMDFLSSTEDKIEKNITEQNKAVQSVEKYIKDYKSMCLDV